MDVCFLQYFRFSVGGMTDIAEIKGHRYAASFIGSHNLCENNVTERRRQKNMLFTAGELMSERCLAKSFSA